jgi:hypothetical protein
MNFSFWRRSASGEKSHKKKNSAEYFSFRGSASAARLKEKYSKKKILKEKKIGDGPIRIRTGDLRCVRATSFLAIAKTKLFGYRNQLDHKPVVAVMQT